jgi:hypothetical protein
MGLKLAWAAQQIASVGYTVRPSLWGGGREDKKRGTEREGEREEAGKEKAQLSQFSTMKR